MYKAELVGGEHDGLIVMVENSDVECINMPVMSTGPAICDPEDIKIAAQNNIITERYTRQMLLSGEPKWVLNRNGVPVL